MAKQSCDNEFTTAILWQALTQQNT